jgi:uncharacterized protein YacL
MKAKVVGIKKTDVTINNDRIKNTKFNLVLNAKTKGLEGQDVDVLSWNELQDGEPPAIKVGQEIDVSYIRSGKLQYDMPETAYNKPAAS